MIDALAFSLLVLYGAAALVLLVHGLNCVVMVYLCARRRQHQRERDRELLASFLSSGGEKRLPVVTTQLPIYNEANVVERLLRAACAIDYPRAKHEIQVLDDSSDHTEAIVAGLVRELRAAGHDIQHIRRTDRVGFKAGALANGLEQARGELVAIFDADFVPQSDFLRRTVPHLVERPELGFVQTRWGHRNRRFSLLTMAQSIGIDGHFAVEQSARSWNGLFLNFNGTAGVWRKRAIEDAGGWQSDTLTEDMDLSYRAQLAGWKPCFLLDVVTPAEIPTDINAFKVQQHRWAKGSIQTARKLLPRILRSHDIPVPKKVQAFLHLTHYGIHPLIVLMSALALPLLLLAERWFHPLVMSLLLAQMVLCLLATNSLYVFSQSMIGCDWWRRLRYLPVLMALGIGMAVNNSRAVFEGLWDRGNFFVRTPKLGDAAESRTGSAYPYRQPFSKLFALELCLGAWTLAAFLRYLFVLDFLVGPILLINAIGYACVGVLSLTHELKTRRSAAM